MTAERDAARCPYSWTAPALTQTGSGSRKQKCALPRGHEEPHRSLTNVVSHGHLLQEQPECHHTPHPPMGYIEFAEWMHKMSKTHVQSRCSICGLWAIWTPKEATVDAV